MDLETKEMHHLKWARLLIKSRGRKVPNRLMVVVRGVVFVICLWWEFSPWLLTTVSKRSCKRPKVRDDLEGCSHPA